MILHECALFSLNKGVYTMEELKPCKICGKLFQSNIYINACPDCITQDEADFESIREYLYQHPRASIYEVATNLDITISKIKHFLKEGRIEIVEKTNQFLVCESCGQSIRSGRLCEECAKQPVKEIKSTFFGSPSGKVDGASKQENTGSKISFLTKNTPRNVK